MDKLITYTMTCHKRLDDLMNVITSVVNAANQSPPVEIVIIDYGEQDYLEPIIGKYKDQLLPSNSLTIKTYRKRKYYHMGHARNLSLRASHGEYVVISATDIFLDLSFFTAAREELHKTNATYLRSMTSGYIGVITCKLSAFLDVGGYDERIEFYGPEDKDMMNRLNRNGAVVGYYDLDKLIKVIRTPDEKRTANYRLKLSKQEMSALGREILEENDRNNVIVANKGVAWGED